MERMARKISKSFGNEAGEEVVSILAESGFDSFVDSDFGPNQKAIMDVADCLRDLDSALVIWSDGSASRINLEELEARLENQGEERSAVPTFRGDKSDSLSLSRPVKLTPALLLGLRPGL